MFYYRNIIKDKEGEAIFHELSAMEKGDADVAYQEMNKEDKKKYHNYLMWRQNIELVKSCAPWVVAGTLVTVVGYVAYRNLSDDEAAEEAESESTNEEFDN